MELVHACAACDATTRRRIGAGVHDLSCDACGKVVTLKGIDEVARDRLVRRCPVCEGTAFYRQRDFNRKLGLAIIVAAAILAVPTGYLSLLAAVIVDALLWFLLPDVTVCYACGTLLRGLKPDPSHKGFDLGLFEHYKRKTGRGASGEGTAGAG